MIQFSCQILTSAESKSEGWKKVFKVWSSGKNLSNNKKNMNEKKWQIFSPPFQSNGFLFYLRVLLSKSTADFKKKRYFKTRFFVCKILDVQSISIQSMFWLLFTNCNQPDSWDFFSTAPVHILSCVGGSFIQATFL